MTLRLYPRLRLDLSWREWAFAASACARSASAEEEAAALEATWTPHSDGLATLSVRSAFDLYLSALDLPRGSEVLLSAVTIPDMVRLVREHGLVPVPVDLDEGTLTPTPETAERAYSPKSRVLVVAHLFGGHRDVGPLAAWARSRNVRLVEDSAQAFRSPDERGSPLADLTFFSFGSIKTLTALGGGLTRVTDPALLARMRALHAAWPIQSTARFARKVAKSAGLLVLQQPVPFALAERLCAARGRDFDQVILSSIRGFPVPPGAPLRPLLQFRPCGALLRTLRHRLETFDPMRLGRRAAQGESVAAALRGVVPVLGQAQLGRTHWLFATQSEDRDAVVARSRARGLDVAAGASNITAVPRPEERPDLPPLVAERIMKRMLFVPVYPEIPWHRLAAIPELLRPSASAGRPAEVSVGH